LRNFSKGKYVAANTSLTKRKSWFLCSIGRYSSILTGLPSDQRKFWKWKILLLFFRLHVNSQVSSWTYKWMVVTLSQIPPHLTSINTQETPPFDQFGNNILSFILIHTCKEKRRKSKVWLRIEASIWPRLTCLIWLSLICFF